MPNKVDFFTLQAKLNLTDFWGSLGDLPSFFTLNLSKNDFTVLGSAHVIFIPSYSKLIPQYIYVLDAAQCKIKLPIVYYDKEGMLFYIDDVLFCSLPDQFNIITVYADKAPAYNLIIFDIYGESSVTILVSNKLYLKLPSNFPTNIPVNWTAGPNITIVHSEQSQFSFIPSADFSAGIVTAYAYVLGYRMYSSFNIRR